MKVKIEEIKKCLVSALILRKVSKADADIIADEYLEGELQGKLSHGLMAFPSLVKKLPLKKRAPKIKKKTSSYIFVDAHQNFGIVVGKTLADKAIRMAGRQGVAVAFISNMLSWLRPSTIAAYIAEQDMIGLVVNSGGNAMIAPHGGYQPLVGTNPIGIGIPSEKGNIVVDMATSKRAWGEVRKALARSTDLPAEIYFDTKGNFTFDPHQAYSVAAAGDYKGFSLALLIEILTGSLIGMPMSQDNEQRTGYRTLPRGAMILVINPHYSTSIKTFKKQNSNLAEKIRKSKKRKGTKVILVPGDRANAKKNKAMRDGALEINKELWDTLASLGSS